MYGIILSFSWLPGIRNLLEVYVMSLSHMSLPCWGNFHPHPYFLNRVYHKWNLNFVLSFSASVEMTCIIFICIFSLDWFKDVGSILSSWNKFLAFCFMMMHIAFQYCWFVYGYMLRMVPMFLGYIQLYLSFRGFLPGFGVR